MSQNHSTTKRNWVDNILTCAIGGTSAMVGTIIVFPLDVIKLRLQLHSESGMRISAAQAYHEIHSNEGYKGFFRALDPAILRQVTAGSLRFGTYRLMSEHLRNTKHRENTMLERVYLSLVSGFLGGVLGTPWEVVIVRMQADQALPTYKRRNYTNPFNAFYRIAKEEGISSIWKGSGITVFIIMLLNLGMLGSYDAVKYELKTLSGRTEDTKEIRVLASGAAGAIASVLGLPFDNVKMKLQNMKKMPNGEFPYKGAFDCFRKSIKNEGVRGLWTGLPVFALTFAPFTMLTLLVQDFLFDTVSILRNCKY
jgi:solute carrier family 25 oxoglutarate transporter 11